MKWSGIPTREDQRWGGLGGNRADAPMGHPIAVLKYFMEEQALKQVDLAELGSQGVVSEILNGRRELNLRQVKALSEQFNVPAAVFI